VKVEISFVVAPKDPPPNQTLPRLSKVFEVEWPGRPMRGEEIELDIFPPNDLDNFVVATARWSTQTHSQVELEPIWVTPEDLAVDWPGGLREYIDDCRNNGWNVSP
jgi:hypothetical protein